MSDGVAGAVWAGVTAAVLACNWRTARLLFPDDPPPQRLLHTIVMSWALLAAAAVTVGSTGVLTPWTLAAVLVIFAGSLLGWSRLCRPRRPQAPTQQAAGAEWWFRAGWMVLAAIWTVRVVTYSVLAFPSDWDTLNYHIPVAHAWLQAESLYAPGCQEWFVPGTNELVGLWLIAPFSGDYLIGLINLPAVAILAVGAIELCRCAGVPPPARNLAAVLAVSSEVAVRQVLTAKNDTAAAALFIAALAYSFRHVRDGRRADGALAAVCLGLLAGVKYYGPGYAAVAGVIWIGCRLTVAGWRAAAWAAAAGVPVALAFGGYWYVRNVALTGTPFYPKGATTATDELSRWRLEGTWPTTLFGNGNPDILPLAFEAIWKHAGPAYYAAVLALPAVLFWLVATRAWPMRGQESDGWRVTRYGVAAAAVGAFLIWGVLPFTVEIQPGTLDFIRGGYQPTRFGLCFLTLCVVAASVPLGDLWLMSCSPLTRVTAIGLPIAVVLGQIVGLARDHRIGGDWADVLLPAAVLLAAGLVVREAWLVASPVVAWVGGSMAVVAVGYWACVQLAANWHLQFAGHYDSSNGTRVFAHLERADPPPRKLFAAGYRVYPFAGSRRQVAVSRMLRLRDEPHFLAYIAGHGVTHVVVQKQEPAWSQTIARIHNWIQGRPEFYRKEFEDDVYLIYVVDRNGIGAAADLGLTGKRGTPLPAGLSAAPAP